jgi:acyl carrier protein
METQSSYAIQNIRNYLGSRTYELTLMDLDAASVLIFISIQGVVSTVLFSRNEIEKKLENIWCKVLGLRKVSIYDNFFEIGGDSLEATTLITKIFEEIGSEVPLGELYKTPTINGVCKYIVNNNYRYSPDQIWR